jgi:hypothetical protein
MAKNEAVTVIYTAWDTAANEPKTGDVANHTIRYVKDGVAATAVASPVEVEHGEYKLNLAADENTGDMMSVIGESSTASIEIIKASWQNRVASWDEAYADHLDAGTFGILIGAAFEEV